MKVDCGAILSPNKTAFVPRYPVFGSQTNDSIEEGSAATTILRDQEGHVILAVTVQIPYAVVPK
jgi:hypothetical protein